MPLRLRLAADLSIPIEVDSLRLENLREQSADEVARTAVQYGNRLLPCGEFFRVSGSARDDQTIVWEGDCARVHRMAAGLTAGTVLVEGNAGMRLGAGLRGGEVLVSGNADDGLGTQMRGGRIIVRGHAGNRVGAQEPGERRGMTGGEILIHGCAGHEVGERMRRGLIAVGGEIGDAAGWGMIAGTILVAGLPGKHLGGGMKRGTIALLQPAASVNLLPTFRYANTGEPVFLQLYLRYLRSLNFPVPEECFHDRYSTYRGDFLELGLGEILCRGGSTGPHQSPAVV